MKIDFSREVAAKKVTDTLLSNGLKNTTQRAVLKWYDEKVPSDIKRKRSDANPARQEVAPRVQDRRLEAPRREVG
jgi:hypothetical protein